MEAETKNEFSAAKVGLRLWLGILLPPAAWAIQLQTVYLTSETGCRSNDFTANHLVSVFAILLSTIGGVIAWSSWLESGKGWKAEDAGTISRSRFMAILGMLLGGLFTLLIFAQWLPTLFGVPCDK
jgi:hypothetical protein